MVDQVPLFPVWVLPEWEDNKKKKTSDLPFFPQRLSNWKEGILQPLFEGIAGKTSNDLVSTLEKTDEQVKMLLQKLSNLVQRIEKTSPAQRRNVDFANEIITLWQQYKKVISYICEEWNKKLNLNQIVTKISELKEAFSLDINDFKVSTLIFHMWKFFQTRKNNNPLPINVINLIICPAFWCSHEEEKKIALWGAYQD